MVLSNGIPFLLIIISILVYIVIRIILAVFCCIMCKKSRIMMPSSEEEPAKTFSDALAAIRVNHLSSYKMQKNDEYVDILREMRKIAKEKNQKEEKIEVKVGSSCKINPLNEKVDENEAKVFVQPGK